MTDNEWNNLFGYWLPLAVLFGIAVFAAGVAAFGWGLK